MPRDEARAEAQTLLLRALESQPGTGMTEGSLRRLTGLGLSLFHEAISVLLEDRKLTVSQGDGRRTQTEYHLVQAQQQAGKQEGPVSPLAAQVLGRLGNRAEGTRAISKALNLGLSQVQQALDELESFRLVQRSQVGMLVIYRVVPA